MKSLINTTLIIYTLLLLIVQQTFAAGMQTQLDNIYQDMENYTAPGSYETMRRSGYTLGRYTYKTKIVNENLISMVAPSAKGGCGGIDAFGGSFSFVNADQLVQLLRQVASNAQGYAFQLAMDNMCPDCMKWMNELQSKVQALNSNLSNSCQLAQGLVNDASSIMPWKIKEKTDASLKASLTGVGDDFGDLQGFISESLTPSRRAKDADADVFAQKNTGNVVYKALRYQNVQNWYTGGDAELIESIMSMTGSVVVGDLGTNPDDNGETTEVIELPGLQLTIQDLIEGKQNAEIYDCSQTDYVNLCRINPADKKTINITGLKERILDAFVGATGLITHIRNGDINANFTDEQKAILAAMPHSIGTKIFQIAPKSTPAAETLIRDVINPVTLEYVWRLIRESVRATEDALAQQKNETYKGKAMDMIKASYDDLEKEFISLNSTYGSVSEVEEKYNNIIKNIDKPNYFISSANNNRAK